MFILFDQVITLKVYLYKKIVQYLKIDYLRVFNNMVNCHTIIFFKRQLYNRKYDITVIFLE